MGWLIGIGALVAIVVGIAGGRDEIRALRSTKNGAKLMLPGTPKRRVKTDLDSDDDTGGPGR